MVEPIWASSCIDSLVSRCSLRPTRRAGYRKIGISTSAMTETCQEKKNIAASTRTSCSTLDTTEASVEVSAC